MSTKLGECQCIAKYKNEFKKVEEKLPPNYTTIYELSKVITSDKKEDTLIFEKLVSDDILSPRMTMKEINMVISTTTKKEILPFVLIDFSKIDKSSRVAVLNQLKVTCRFHNLPMRQSFKIDIDTSNLIDNFFADEVNISDVEEVTH